jgi:hypothetical protein
MKYEIGQQVSFGEKSGIIKDKFPDSQSNTYLLKESSGIYNLIHEKDINCKENYMNTNISNKEKTFEVGEVCFYISWDHSECMSLQIYLCKIHKCYHPFYYIRGPIGFGGLAPCQADSRSVESLYKIEEMVSLKELLSKHNYKNSDKIPYSYDPSINQLG